MPQLTEKTSLSLDYRRKLKERESDIQLLQETFRLVASEFNLEKIYKTIAQRALHLVAAETLLIPILDQNRKSYTYVAGAGLNADEIVGQSLPLEFGICGWVWEHKKTWWKGILNELSDKERNQWEKEAGSIILVPLQGRKTFLGGIAAMNKKDGLEFNQRDLNMLTMFAGIVSIAIENALSYQQLKDTQKNLLDHQHRIERLNKQYSESSHKIEQLTLYDSLTGLPNRTLFRDRMNTHLAHAERSSQPLQLMLIDIDNFKVLNDALGYEIGDHILIEFCKRIKNTCSADETFSRLGSDEFVLIIPDATLSQAQQRAEKILKDLDNEFNIVNNKITIQASIGLASYPEHGTERGHLLRHADIALNISKKNNEGLHTFKPEHDEEDSSQIGLALDINTAFNENQFEVYFQPKIDIKSNSLISAEALGRWNHPGKGIISPNIFIDALEQYNSIDRYTFNLLDQVINCIEQWTQAGHNIKIAINISTRTLMSPRFIPEIQSRISDFSISRRIIFEITESLVLSESEQIYESLVHLRALGIELSIDDFGTGYSSLSRLKKLPVSEVKIDQSFIKDMATNVDDQIIVKSIIDLAHNLGLTVVAEGVERREIIEQLSILGCDVAQGFLISEPLCKTGFEAFLNKR